MLEIEMRTTAILLLCGLFAPGFALATDCASISPAQPLRPTYLVPVASELTQVGNELGAQTGVLSQTLDESESVDQVLLRIRIESCQNVASITPVPSAVSPDDPAAYKPRTEFDNTPWRFNMSQNGKNMTADEFSAWMKSRGVRVARGAGAAPVPAVALPSQDAPATTPQPAQPEPATQPAVPPTP
jgi:hypothetical protein